MNMNMTRLSIQLASTSTVHVYGKRCTVLVQYYLSELSDCLIVFSLFLFASVAHCPI